MHVFERGDVYVDGDESQLVEAFGVAYVMLLEDDGINVLQLKKAGLVGFVENWLEKRLCEGEDGWPVDNETSALALNILWQLTDKGGWRRLSLRRCVEFLGGSNANILLDLDMISVESQDRREHIQALLKPIAMVGSRVRHTPLGPCTALVAPQTKYNFYLVSLASRITYLFLIGTLPTSSYHRPPPLLPDHNPHPPPTVSSIHSVLHRPSRTHTSRHPGKCTQDKGRCHCYGLVWRDSGGYSGV